MAEPIPIKWIYTIPVAGGELEAELWSASTSKSEIRATVAHAHQIPESQVRIRRAA